MQTGILCVGALCQGQGGICLTGANLIAIHTHRCIKRSPLPSPRRAGWITVLPHDFHAGPISQSATVNAKGVLTEHYIQSLYSLIKGVSIWRADVCVYFPLHRHTSACCWESADSFLRVIIKDDCVSRPPLPSDPNRPLLTGVPLGS